MEIINIKTIEDINSLKYKYNCYDEIIIYTNLLKYKGIIRYAFKYAFWSLINKGKLTIIDEPHKSFGKKTDFIDFWQIKHELFNSLKTDILILSINDKLGKIELIKNKAHNINNGISFAIVFSGAEKELELLSESINSILNMNIHNDRYEILISGPSFFNYLEFLKRYTSYPIKYLTFDFLENKKRLMITQKKNCILSNARFDIVSINHTRIVYSEDFYKKIIEREFDLITTKVIGIVDNKEYSFLDFGLISDYNLSKKSNVRTFVGSFINRDYLNYLTNRVPYIDGGLTIFNKRNLENLKYNDNIAWGEAEDVELCGNAYNKGFLIDYFDDIKCQSKVLKFNPKLNLLNKIKQKILLRINKGK